MAYKQKNFFEFRDSLAKGEPDKVIKGMHFDQEFGAIQDAFEKVTGDIEIDGKPLPDLLDEKADQVDLEKEIQDRKDADDQLRNDFEADLAQEVAARIAGDQFLQDEIDALEGELADEVTDRQDGDTALGNRIDNLATDDLVDVNSANAKLDQFLIHNGTQWVAEDFHIDTELTYQGGISVVNDPAPSANNGDLYINNEGGTAGVSWTGIAGKTVTPAVAVGWSTKNARWYMLGDIASAAVMRVEAGTGIDVDDTKPAEPVVSIDRTETDKWYEPPIDPKRTAFNQNFGTSSGTVAEGDHNHDGDYADINHDHDSQYADINHLHDDRYLQQKDFVETDPTVPQHVKNISTNDIDRWDEAHGWGDHNKEGYLTIDDFNGVGDQVDNYQHWSLTANGASSTNITSKAVVDIKGGGATTVSKSGNTITVSTPAAQSGGVTEVKQGAGITVNSADAAKPIVSVNRTDVDKWYEPKFSKNNAFNKNFGTAAGTVAQGNHTHNYAPAGDSYTKTESDSKYEPKFTKNTAFNKNFGTTSGTVAQGNHTHDTYSKNEIDVLLENISAGGGGIMRKWATQPYKMGDFEKASSAKQTWTTRTVPIASSGQWVEFPIPANHFFDLDAIGTNGSFSNGSFLIMGRSTVDGVAIDEEGFDQDISNALSASTTWNVWYPARIDAEFKIGNESKLGSSYHANHIIAVVEQSIRLFIKPAPGSPNPTINCEALIQGRLYSK